MTLLSLALGVVLSQAAPAAAGCTKDTDCKGDRICEAGVCVSPAAGRPVEPHRRRLHPPAPPPLAAESSPLEPSAFPRVVRRDGQVCVHTLEANEQVAESCRPEGEQPRPRPLSTSGAPDAPAPGPQLALEPLPRRERPPSAASRENEDSARGVAEVLLHGGALFGVAGGSVGVTGDVGVTVAFGGAARRWPGVRRVGAFDVGAGNGTVLVGTLAPGLRLGNRTHALFAVEPSVVAYLGGGSGGAGLAGSLLVTSLFSVTRAFGITVHSALHLHTLGVVFSFGAGVGFGAL